MPCTTSRHLLPVKTFIHEPKIGAGGNLAWGTGVIWGPSGKHGLTDFGLHNCVPHEVQKAHREGQTGLRLGRGWPWLMFYYFLMAQSMGGWVLKKWWTPPDLMSSIICSLFCQNKHPWVHFSHGQSCGLSSGYWIAKRTIGKGYLSLWIVSLTSSLLPSSSNT